MSRDWDYTWMIAAREELGTKEIAGPKHEEKIIRYHAATTLKATTDEIPWCSSFVNWVMAKAGCHFTRSAAARSWLNYGIESDLQYGAIIITSRGNDPKAGHVGFLTKFTKDRIWLLGGNQSDQVKISSFPRNRVIGVRMPHNSEMKKIKITPPLA
jgi:uncharacterized protein (TIGR02594 family)